LSYSGLVWLIWALVKEEESINCFEMIGIYSQVLVTPMANILVRPT